MDDFNVLSSEINRRELLKRGAFGAALLASGSLLAACGSSGGSTSTAAGGGPAVSGGPQTGGTPVKGGTLRIGMLSNGNAETIDVRTAFNNQDIARTDNIYDPLFFARADGKIAPGLATEAEPNADATQWTFKIRQGVTFHDGKALTADDVVYTIKTWGSPESYFSEPTAGLIDFKGVRKLDATTVVVPLLRPFATFPELTSWFNAYIVQDGTTDFTSNPVGTGPFVFKSFQPGANSTFTANADYWQGAPNLEELVIDTSFTDDAARINALLSGEVDIAPQVPPQLAAANAGSGKLVLGNSPGPGFEALVMQVNQPPFNDKRVVQAMKLLTNRQPFVDNVFSGYAVTGNDLVAPTLQFFASDIKAEYDPEKAKSLLKAAGQENLDLTLYTSQLYPGMVELATLWSSQAGEIDVSAKVDRISPSAYFTDAFPGYLTDQRPFSGTVWSVVPWSLGSMYLMALTSEAAYPETMFGDKPGQDKLVFEAMGEQDPAKAEEKWQAVQQQQVEEGGYLIPAPNNYVDAYASNVRGVQTTSAGNCDNFTFNKAWLES